MGEVYRADDMKLGKQVALKFLPAGALHQKAIERLYGEVLIWGAYASIEIAPETSAVLR